jgi:hypothetical protein
VNEPPSSITPSQQVQRVARRIRERVPDGVYCQALLYVVEQAWEGGVSAVRTVEQLYTGADADGLYLEAERLVAFRERAGNDVPLQEELLEIINAELNPPRAG